MSDISQIKLPNGSTYDIKDNRIPDNYITTHPENPDGNFFIVPFINNDIAHLLKRGGTVIVKVDGTVVDWDLSNAFDGSPSYVMKITSDFPNGENSVVEIELTLFKKFLYNNTIYVDHGHLNWRAKNIKIETALDNDEYTVILSKSNNTSSHYYDYRSYGATGFNKIRLTFTDFAGSNFRIACIGVITYNSNGLRETFLPRDGGELYGDLTLSNGGTTEENIPTQLIFSNEDTTTGKAYSKTMIAAYNDHASPSNGNNLVIKPGGNLFIGSGEAPEHHYDLVKGTTENTYMTADATIFIQGGANTLANRKGFCVNSSGTIIPVVADTAKDNTISIGSSTNRFANIYARYFRGALIGGASGLTLNSSVIKVKEDVAADNIIVADDSGQYYHLKTGRAFDIRFPIVHVAGSASVGQVYTTENARIQYPITITVTQSMDLIEQQPVYIKGHLSGTTFTPISTTPLTQTEPTSNDGYQYMFLGVAYSKTGMYLLANHPVYAYVDGVFKEYNPIDSGNIIATFTSADVAQADATSYTDPGVLTSGETHKSIFGKISQIAKNVKYLYKMLGTTDISTMGDGTITNALSVLNNNGIKSITRSGTTFTVTRNDDTTFTFDQQDNNTWNANSVSVAGYVAAPTTSRPRYFYSTDNNGAPGWRQNITVVGASSSADGTAGLVPAPTSANYDNRTFMYLRSDGKWQYLPLANNATTTATHYALDARMGKTLDGEIAVKISVFDDTTNGLKVGSTLNLPSISFNMVNSLSICNVLSTNRMFVMTGGVISETFRFSGVYMDADGKNPVSVGLDILFNPSTKKVTKIVKSSNWPSNVTTVGQLELFILRKTLT